VHILMLAVAIDARSAFQIRDLRQLEPEKIRLFAGIHPSEVRTGTEAVGLESLWNDADGVGEIGLDPRYSPVGDKTPQEEAFCDQLRVAERLSKPVQVHSRGSEVTCLEKLSTFRPRRVLMHWFEHEDLAKLVVSRGYYVSF